MKVQELLPKNKKNMDNLKKIAKLPDKEIEPLIHTLLEWAHEFDWYASNEVAKILLDREDLIYPSIEEILKGEDIKWKVWVLDKLVPHFNKFHKEELKPVIQRLRKLDEAEESIQLVKRYANECYNECFKSKIIINVNLEKTKEYYEEYEDICDCEYCRNYCLQIKKEYPKLAEYLNKYNINIEKPWELVSIEEKDEVYYLSCMYVVMGNCGDEYKKSIDDINIYKSTNYPNPKLEEEYFVLEFSTISLSNILKKKKKRTTKKK